MLHPESGGSVLRRALPHPNRAMRPDPSADDGALVSGTRMRDRIRSALSARHLIWSAGRSAVVPAGRAEAKKAEVVVLDRRFIALTLTAVLAAAAPLAPQNAEMIPAEFVRVVLGRGMYEPVVMAGQVPEEVTAVVELPQPARILGTVGYDASMTVYLVAPGDADEMRAFFARQFASSEWTVRQPRRRTGFVGDAPDLPAVFCRDDRTVLSVDTQDYEGDLLLRIGYQANAEQTRCDNEVRVREVSQSSYQMLRDHLPVLSTPEGEVRNGSSMGGGMGTVSSGIQIATGLTAAQIAEHVASDLIAQEWQSDAVGMGETSSVSTWRRDFDDGVRAFGELLIMQEEPGDYRVEFRLTDLNSPDRIRR